MTRIFTIAEQGDMAVSWSANQVLVDDAGTLTIYDLDGDTQMVIAPAWPTASVSPRYQIADNGVVFRSAKVGPDDVIHRYDPSTSTLTEIYRKDGSSSDHAVHQISADGNDAILDLRSETEPLQWYHDGSITAITSTGFDPTDTARSHVISAMSADGTTATVEIFDIGAGTRTISFVDLQSDTSVDKVYPSGFGVPLITPTGDLSSVVKVIAGTPTGTAQLLDLDENPVGEEVEVPGAAFVLPNADGSIGVVSEYDMTNNSMTVQRVSLG